MNTEFKKALTELLATQTDFELDRSPELVADYLIEVIKEELVVFEDDDNDWNDSGCEWASSGC